MYALFLGVDGSPLDSEVPFERGELVPDAVALFSCAKRRRDIMGNLEFGDAHHNQSVAKVCRRARGPLRLGSRIESPGSHFNWSIFSIVCPKRVTHVVSHVLVGQ